MENWRKYLKKQEISPVTNKPYPAGLSPEKKAEYDDWAAGKFSPTDIGTKRIKKQKAQAGSKAASLQPGEIMTMKTVGDLRKVIEKAKLAKRDVQGKQALKDLTIGAVPLGNWLSAVKSVKDLLVKTYSLPDDKVTKTGLDALNIDDELSAIIDDNVENRFINWLVKTMEGQPDDTPLQKLDFDRLLQKFLMSQYDQRTVTSPELKE
tara:strand:- start:403 stop:1023 length:621 start_codon:yes stop_codon:yes gene_type:complete